jgi:hypothetical protein
MRKILFLLSTAVSCVCYAQQSFTLYPYATDVTVIKLEEMTIPSFPKFHSSAVGFYDGKWVIIGGRTNGLHGFYPPFAFPANGIQNQIHVVDPGTGSIWSSGLDSLPQPLKEQFSSSNMQHCVKGNKLYISGGYGYSQTADEYITFPYFTEVNMDTLIEHIVTGSNPSNSFKYTVDSAMAVTGGRMHQMDGRFYLFFGHKFTGRYSITPGALFEQEYTYQIRMFNITTTADSLNITNYTAVTDSVNFRRRDLNVTPYLSDANLDSLGFMAWSGVFRADADRPHTNQVFIRPDGTYSIVNYEQKYNQYHCAAIPVLYSSYSAVIFFGGMAESKAGTATKDTLVPFVKNVSVLSNTPSQLQENIAFDTLGSFMGTNAEFIPHADFFDEERGMTKIQGCDGPILIGYIVGGIESTGPNISDLNDPSMSFASDKVYKVFATKYCWGIDEYNASSVQVYPNPSQDRIQVKTDESVTEWQVVDISGKTVITKKSGGINSLDVSGLESGTYFVKVLTEQHAYRSSFIKL